MANNTVEKLPFDKLIIFALGQLGWSLASFAVGNALIYFYMPPESGNTTLFPNYIFQGAILGFITLIGLINAGGRLFDAFIDPWLANLSDRNKSRFGRRRIFMAFSALPLAIFSFLIFVPLTSGVSTLNSVWLIICITLFYISITAYTMPYNALISELGHTPSERLNISTAISVTFALGFAIGNQIYVLTNVFSNKFHLNNTAAFQMVQLIFVFISLILMLLPVIFINENRYVEKHTSDDGVIKSIKKVFKNKNFLRFSFADLTYFLSLNFIQMGISYFIITLLGLDKGLISFLMLILFGVSFLFYVPINILAKKIGKKRIMIFAFIMFAIDFLIIALLNKFPVSHEFQAYAIVIIAAIPIAIFGILPTAIVADIAEADGIETGDYKAGIFFGTRTFMMKLGISVANLLFPSFLLLGKSVEDPTGIRVAAFAAVIFCVIGLSLFITYNEKKVLDTLKKKEQIV